MRLLCFGSAIRSKYRWKNLLLASQSISADIQGRMTKAGETGSVTLLPQSHLKQCHPAGVRIFDPANFSRISASHARMIQNGSEALLLFATELATKAT